MNKRTQEQLYGLANSSYTEAMNRYKADIEFTEKKIKIKSDIFIGYFNIKNQYED